MSTGTPEKLIPRRLDPRKMAHQHAFFRGSIPADALPRLQKAVASVDRVAAEVEFSLGDDREKLLRGTLDATVDVICQRCLEPFSQQIHSDFSIAAVWSEEEAKALASAYDPWIVGEGEGDLYEILEEELLLSLPVVTFHQGDCIDAALLSSGESAAEEAESTPNPFQVLQQLKGNIKK